MNYDLISETEFLELPREPQKRFLALERICRDRTNQAIDREDWNSPNMGVRLQYINVVAAAAEELGIPELSLPMQLQNESAGDRFDRFIGIVSFQTTKLRLRALAASDNETVLLANASRAKIELQIRRLRDLVTKSDLPQDRKDGLLRKLDELSHEVIQPRAKLSVLMGTIAALGLIAGTTSFLADAPDAIITISRIVGADVEAEEVEYVRLNGPIVQRQITAQQPDIPATAPAFEPGGMDEDIPF